ncbi:hypothetical protein B446_00610 [Streptomyces collinus Tu 365]|uniref:Uncharacterized protein n=2 Tax=Streptomyces collinus TaxID=42684 RepID=S5V913_STRC3|nr:hypothetical protein B446_00610 [Streptomyces collinus Tu 365]
MRASSTPSRKRLPLAVAAAVATLTALWVLFAPGIRHVGVDAEGHALDGNLQSGMFVFNDHAQIGSEYWVALPPVSNTSKKPLMLLDAKITHVPKGLKVVEYRAVSAKDTEGHALIISTGGKHGMPDLAKLHDYAGQPIEVKSKTESDFYYSARVRVTGRVHENLTGCRFWYRQGSTKYHQDLGCTTEIRLGPHSRSRIE